MHRCGAIPSILLIGLAACADSGGGPVTTTDTETGTAATDTNPSGMVACTTDEDGGPFEPARVGVAEPGGSPEWFDVHPKDGCTRIDLEAGTWEVRAEAVGAECSWGPEPAEVVDGEFTWLFIQLASTCVGR